MQTEDHFGGAIAANYDDDEALAAPETVTPVIDVLAELAGDGPALEFAIGTGRIALPLIKRGVPVTGIEYSQDMTDRLHAKPEGADIDVTIGDMATARVPGRFSLVYLVFNTISNLTSQEAQTACFENAAAHLAPGGYFVIECGIPPLQKLAPGETLLAFDRSETHWGMDEIDVVSQNFSSHHMRLRGGVWQRNSVPFRYVWPSELDLMARIAGLRLTHRWADWARNPLTATSPSHVSVWQKPE
jgi:SAM-dependent methyltransferase